MSAINDDNLVLIGETDAYKWAEHFLSTRQRVLSEGSGDIADDESTMMGWFANAIMSGHDWGERKERERPIADKIREAVFQAAGAGTAAIMSKPGVGHVVMPSEEVSEACESILKEFGFADEAKA